MVNVGEKVLSIHDDDYQKWIKDLKTRFKQSQIKSEMGKRFL